MGRRERERGQQGGIGRLQRGERIKKLKGGKGRGLEGKGDGVTE